LQRASDLADVHGASTPVPGIEDCDARPANRSATSAKGATSPMTADAQLSHVIAERHATQVGSTLPVR